jgi:LmbE family N-acetylglucosaminyl deacetylase
MAELLEFPDDFSSVLCIVAHPDDLEFGAASVIAKWTAAGKAVDYMLVTSGEAGIDGLAPDECGPIREAEERAGAEIVGVSSVEFLGYPDGVVEYGLDLRRDLARVIRVKRPDLVVTGNREAFWPGRVGFNMADHRAVGAAVLDAARDAANRWIFTELLAEGHEPWNGLHRVALAASPYATHAVDITGWLDRGIASLEAHERYLAGLGDDWPPADMFLTERAEQDGRRLDVEHAVAFELVEL